MSTERYIDPNVDWLGALDQAATYNENDVNDDVDDVDDVNDVVADDDMDGVAQAAVVAEPTTDMGAVGEDEKPATGVVSSPVAGGDDEVTENTPLLAASAPDTTSTTTDDVLENSESKAAAPTAAAPAPTAPTAPPTSGSSFGSGANTTADAGTCPMICSPGLQRLWRWMTWQETTPGIAILTTAVAWYCMHLQGWRSSTMVSIMLIGAVLAGGLVKVHNHFMDAETHIHIPKVSAEAVATAVASHIKVVVEALVNMTQKAVEWKSTTTSLHFIAHFWLLSRFSGIIFCPTVIVLALFVMFFAPIGFKMVGPQLKEVYDSSAKPVVSKVVGKAHTLFNVAHSLDKNKLYMVGAGAVGVLLLFWQLFSSFFSLWCLLSCAITTSSLVLVGMEHAKAFGCPGCPGMSDKKKTQ